MVRRYGDPVTVRPEGEGSPGGDEPPSSFLWRGRLYVVRSVLGHWRERRAWWTEDAAQAVHGDSCSLGGTRSGADERQVWRVEAGCGRTAGLGVYDLCHDPGRDWSLVRVGD